MPGDIRVIRAVDPGGDTFRRDREKRSDRQFPEIHRLGAREHQGRFPWCAAEGKVHLVRHVYPPERTVKGQRGRVRGRQAGQGQELLQIGQRMLFAARIPHGPQFQGDRGAAAAECPGEGGGRLDDVYRLVGKQAGQSEALGVEFGQEAVVRVHAGVVVQVHHGVQAVPPEGIHDRSAERSLVPGGFAPDAVEVLLVGQFADARGGGGDVADEQDQAARGDGMPRKQLPDTVPAAGLVAVQEYGNEQRRLLSPRNVDH